MNVVLEINGEPAQQRWLRHLAQHSYGHFTAMQVRDGRVRGRAAHLARLTAANRDLFDIGLDHDEVMSFVRHALGDTKAASVRISVVRGPDDEPGTMVTVRPPAHAPTQPHRVLSVPFQRPVPWVKQVGGGFGQVYYNDMARRRGYSEILLTDPAGVISEGGITNVGLFDGTAVVWPDAPMLTGITMQLLEPLLPSQRRVLRVADLADFDGMFTTNSRGLTAVGSVDDTVLPIDPDLMKLVTGAYESVPWDVL